MSYVKSAVSLGVLGMVAAVALVATASPQQQPSSLTNDPRTSEVIAAVEAFLDQLAQGQTEAAYTAILQNSLIREQKEEVADLQVQTRETIASYGNFIERERLSAEQVGTGLLFLRYLYKCEDLPLVWYFTYYRPSAQDPWKLIIIRFDLAVEEID